MGSETHIRTNDPLAPSHDVLALIADVERTIGTLRERAGGEVQRAGEEVARLAREVETLQDERSTLLGRQMTLVAELATERGARDAERSDFASRLESAQRAGAQAVAEAEARLADAERRLQEAVQEAVQAASGQRAAIEEELATARERIHMLDERLIEAENAIASDRARVKTVERRATEERTALAARIAELEAQLAAATQAGEEDLEEAALEFANDHAELEETIESLRAELEARTQELTEARARADEAQARGAEASGSFEQFTREHEALGHRLEQSEAARRAGDEAVRDLREHVAFREARIAQLDEALDACRARIAELESQVAARAGEAAGLARKVVALEQAAQSSAAGTAAADVEARARALADTQVAGLLAAKGEQLSLAANFIRHRHERLVNLHKGIKAKARRVRAEKAALDAARTAAPAKAEPVAFPGHEGPVTSFDETRVAAERSALARERKEIAELRAVLASSEEMLARRATGISSIGTAAASICFLALAALASWHVAGVFAQPPALASMEFATTRQGAEGRPAPADAAALTEWLKSELGNAGFVGLVASRLNERGRSHADSSAMVAGLRERLRIEPQGVGTVRLTVHGADAGAAAATVDAVMSTVIYQANRDPVRASDGIRVGHANASNSAGGIPQPRIETLPDPARLARSGLVFGVLGAVGVAAGFVRYRAGRRALHGLV